MSDKFELRNLPIKELADRADALEEEAALTRAVHRMRVKQEAEREQMQRAVAAAEARKKGGERAP